MNRQVVLTSANKKTVSTQKPIPVTREQKLNTMLRKEAALRSAIKTQAGLAKIAANLSSPVRIKLDYEGIFRKFVVVEPWPDGYPLIYDKDIVEFSAAVTAMNGTVRRIDCASERVTLTEVEIVTRPKVPFRELYIRLFSVLNRTKERLSQGMQLKEDNIGFGLIDTASTLSYAVTAIGTALTRDALAKAFAPIENSRNIVTSILLTAYGIAGIRRWQYLDLDQVAMQEVRKTGYLGDLWGASFYISDQIPQGTFYIMGQPEKLGWMPIRKDAYVIEAPENDNLLMGFVGYQLNGFTIHNSLAVSKGTFSYTA